MKTGDGRLGPYDGGVTAGVYSADSGNRGSILYEWVMLTLGLSIAVTEQYFVNELSIARSTSFATISLP